METLAVLYNFLLTAIYMIPLTLAFLCHMVYRKPMYLYSGLLFLFYLLTNILVRLYEAVPAFYNFYASIFMTVPTIRTVIFAGYLFCLIQICIAILDDRHKIPLFGWLIALICYLMFIPMFPNGMLKLFLYYTPVQIFTFFLSVYGLARLPKAPRKESDYMHRIYRLFFQCTLIFSLLIILEDYIFMFYIDVYSEDINSSSITFRSISEDLMSICHAFLITVLLLPMLRDRLTESARIHDTELSSGSPEESVTEPEPPKTLNDIEKSVKQKTAGIQQNPTGENGDDIRFYFFCQEYLLTTREQDILRLLLGNKNNMEISDELYISVGTAKTHIHNIYVKLDVNRRSELTELYRNYRVKSDA